MKPIKKPKYEVLTVTVPTTAVANQVIEKSIQLDKDYGQCVGVGVSIEGTLSTLSHVNVGIRDAYGQVHDDCHIEQFLASSAVAPDNKMKEVNIKTDRMVYARVTPPAAPAADVKIQFIFKLTNELEVVEYR